MKKEKFIESFPSYQGISAILKECSYQEIVTWVSELCSIGTAKLEEIPMGGYSRGRTSGAYRFVLQDLLKNVEHFDWLFSRLQDEESKRVFTRLLQFRIVPDLYFIEQAYDGIHSQYFDQEMVFCDDQEVFVDCGGFIGDTVEEYIRIYHNYKQIYVYEPSEDNISSCRKNLQPYPNITIRNCGVGEKNCRMSMENNRDSSNFNLISNEVYEQGAKRIANIRLTEHCLEGTTEVVSLDEDIKETVSFIKMDVEGFEIPALIGAKRHIREENPKLAICTYHIVSDLWEIPRLIDSINSGYQFYIRHYRKTQNWETVLYAIPANSANPVNFVNSTKFANLANGANLTNEANLTKFVNFTNQIKKKKEHGKSKRVVAVAAPEAGWYNIFLTKDCGLIPYLLYKNHGCDVSMLGAKIEEYPYLNSYVKGLKMEFLSTGSEEERIQYMKENAIDIDALLLRGAYSCNFNIARIYKEINPEGKIYLGLDANSFWMDRILWKEERFLNFMNCCDVIAASGRAIQKHLNEKWPWEIVYIPNGYYHYGFEQKKPVFEEKENIILTVGRLGSEQKATHVLVEAFACIAEQIPDFQLRMVGTVEKEFEIYMERYLIRYPQLKKRITLTGMITDKKELLKEYQRAKIFALPSIMEGGTPNVISEALFAGCVTAVTEIDEWRDATDNGACGMVAKRNDPIGFSEILLTLCKREDLSDLSAYAYQYARKNYDMEVITAKVNEMLFGGK